MHVPAFIPPILLAMVGLGFFQAFFNMDHSTKAVFMVLCYLVQALFLILNMRTRERSLDKAHTYMWLFIVTAMVGNFGSAAIDILWSRRPAIADIASGILLAGILYINRGRKNGKRAKKLLSEEAETLLGKLKRTATRPAEN